MAKRTRQPINQESWPSWRYGPFGEKGLFERADDVPAGWARKPQLAYEVEEPVKLNREQLAAELIERGVKVHGAWSAAYMWELLNQ